MQQICVRLRLTQNHLNMALAPRFRFHKRSEHLPNYITCISAYQVGHKNSEFLHVKTNLCLFYLWDKGKIRPFINMFKLVRRIFIGVGILKGNEVKDTLNF